MLQMPITSEEDEPLWQSFQPRSAESFSSGLSPPYSYDEVPGISQVPGTFVANHRALAEGDALYFAEPAPTRGSHGHPLPRYGILTSSG